MLNIKKHIMNYLYRNKLSIRSFGGKILSVADNTFLSGLMYPVLVRMLPSDINICVRYLNYIWMRGGVRKLNSGWSSGGIRNTLENMISDLRSGEDARRLSIFRRSSVTLKKSFLRLLLNTADSKIVSEVVEANQLIIEDIYKDKISKYFLFKIFNVVDIEEVSAVERRKYSDHSEFHFNEPTVLPAEIVGKERVLQIPGSVIYSLKDVNVIAAAQVLKGESLVVYEPASHPENGAVAGSWQYVSRMYKKSKALVCIEATNKVCVNEAVLIAGRSSKNYFHWLVEYLPRIWTVDQDRSLDKIPLIIPLGLPDQYYEVLEILNSKKRPIILMDDETVLNCKKLHIPNYQTNIVDNLKDPYWKTSGISMDHLSFVRNTVFKHYGVVSDKSPETPKKIYISRSGYRARSLVNESKVEKLLKEKGFEVIFPETMSFKEQVLMFSQADIIVTPSGASLANTMFCKDGAIVVGLLSEVNKDYCLFSNVSSVANVSYYHVQGSPLEPENAYKNSIEYRFGAYKVDIKSLQKSIELSEQKMLKQLVNKYSQG